MPLFPRRFAMFLLISSPDAAVVRSGAMASPPAAAERERAGGASQQLQWHCVKMRAGKRSERGQSGRGGARCRSALSVSVCLTQKSVSCHRKDKLPVDLISYNDTAWLWMSLKGLAHPHRTCSSDYQLLLQEPMKQYIHSLS